MITLYTGEFLISPIPLECSLHVCNYGCAYCFATLNYRHSRYRADVPGIMSLLATYPHRHTLVARLLQSRYPVLLSNHTDPFAPSNAAVILPILESLAARGIPVAFQTRGGTLVADALRLIDPSCWYVTVTSDRDLRAIEPGAPPYAERLRTIDRLLAHGQSVSIGLNPYVPAWWADLPGALRTWSHMGVHGVWVELLHLHYRQRNLMTDAERQGIGADLLADAMKRRLPAAWIAAYDAAREQIQAAGMAVFSGGQGCASEFFTPYRQRYTRTFPVIQEWINRYHAAPRAATALIPFDEFWGWAAPFLPPGTFVGMSKYIGTVAHNFFWKQRVPNRMSFRQLCHVFWQYPEIGRHPCATAAFAFPARWDAAAPAGWIQYVAPDLTNVVTFQGGNAKDWYAPMEKASLWLPEAGTQAAANVQA